jgi:hypothetical protein
MADADYDALLVSLRELTSAPSGGDFTRTNLIALLDVLTSHLGKALATQESELEDGTHVELEHPVVSQLAELASALEDLDRGLTDPALRAYKHGANATLPWNVRDQDKALVEALKVYRSYHNLDTEKDAAGKMAKVLNATGYRRRGKQLTGKSLLRLKYP